jgi:recombination protein RecR
LAASAGPEIERLIALLSKLALLKRREQLLIPLSEALSAASARVKTCSVCGSLDTQDPCAICSDPGRDAGLICVVEEVGSIWAMERASAFRGKYHVLGGLLSALDGVGPDALRIGPLVERASQSDVREVILALPATVDGQTTAHYLAERLARAEVSVTMLARGVPVGGELDWLDDGTIAQAMRARRPA